ncbi:helix-turn-helix domain-containing protein [Streptomyces corynorhini]|uniref:Helix-turn-helix domain-containing protein n=1 Tax=Streptomyces corynorhini TaxID=2282652 RepID=A0A370B7U5_9ACTN|nr:helix-turn-helix domain-containing protein [Streptomyces corynorhini]RDG35816.1 helix-turn-helix domain-containing protein [Streptomyces corynorhini]
MTQNTTRKAAEPAVTALSGAPDASLPSPTERRRLREAKSMTEKQVATAVGVTRSTIRSWETGRTTPRGRKGQTYAKLLAGIEAEIRQREAQARKAEREAVKAAQARSAARLHSTHGSPAFPTGPPPRDDGDGQERTATATVARELDPAPASRAGAGPAAGPPAAAPSADADAHAHADAEADATAGPGHVAGAGTGAAEAGIEAESRPAPLPVPDTPDQAFDALYTHSAPSLARQAFLLTGRRALSKESVEQAFHLAWQRWPEVAVDRDPAGWVRVAAYEYAMSPWHKMRRVGRRPDRAGPGDGGPGARALHEALLALPPAYRRTLLLYDGLGLNLPETAAETEASTPATVNRLTYARDAVTARLPELADPEVLHERLGTLARTVTPPKLAPPLAVRSRSERRIRLWTRAAIAFTALILGATSFTLATAPTHYEPRLAPAEPVGGVPGASGPQRLSPQDLKLRDRLRAEPMNGPYRLVPRPV